MSKAIGQVCACVCANATSPPPTRSTNCFHYGKRKTQSRRFITLISKQPQPPVAIATHYSQLPGDGVIVLIMQTMSARPFLAGRH
uniref:Uncharacterized protein n=1 Tax=Drosophila melanogaster TaxID=7227 RepID=A0A0B4LHG3_DROME|nr:uncharacterized protein Dmel_CG45218 [Drosophila melanogaster]AHN57335.1 uncharacterized protein Dmel_CG45218 [Drosophila melanogaster]|eukprot:NP_001287336.1 uncharacterized protein Dmel_CG45218 [Drosophila melanogaster]